VSYTVFARKYRPQTFDDVVGQEHITRTLKNAILQNRLAHAYLFVGPRGTGKTSSARILAKALNCLSSPGPTLTPCDQCDSCKEITAGNSLDVLEFDAASNTQVDKVREIIIDNVKYLPARGRFKVYLVDEVHMLSSGSFNALLKTLEEPPPHVKFLFATTDVQKLPATILSRCQRFDLKRIGAPVIAGHLLHIASREGVQLSEEAALAVAVGADGGMRDAESMLDQLVAFCGGKIEEADVLSVFGFTSRQKVSDLCSALLAQDASVALALVHEQAEAGRDLTQLLGDLISHLRNLLLVQADPAALEMELGRAVVESLQTQCQGVDRERLLELIDLCASAEQKMKWASNKQMYLEVAMLRAIQAVGQVTLGEVLGALSALRDGRPIVERAKPVFSPVQVPAPKAKPVSRTEEPSVTKLAAGTAASIPQTVSVHEDAAASAYAADSDAGLSAVAVVKAEPEVEAAGVPAVGSAPNVLAVKADAREVSELGAQTSESAVKTPTPKTPPRRQSEPPAARVAESGVATYAAVNVESLWPVLVEAVRKERPLISMWLEGGVLAEVSGGVARLAFPKEQSLSAEYLLQANNRSFLEALLLRLTGSPVSLSTELSESVVLRPVAQPPPPAKEVEKDPMEEFKNDPLIRKALDIFKARLEVVQ
jgi:DNA polymerase-3 subunit gamma/tau